MSASEIYFPYGKENMPWNSDKYVLIDQFPPHKKTETTHSGLFHILFHYTWKFRLTPQVKHGDFPFPTRTVLEQKKRHAA